MAVAQAERFLKQNEFVEAVVRVSYAKHPELPNLADKVIQCMDEKFLPFSKHKGSQITNWFRSRCAVKGGCRAAPCKCPGGCGESYKGGAVWGGGDGGCGVGWQ